MPEVEMTLQVLKIMSLKMNDQVNVQPGSNLGGDYSPFMEINVSTPGMNFPCKVAK